MSSESSISSGSRIRQFGLYRSIDARTEEFLRLSMKRQIRQGCACAAVSTAITITVVVVVLIVYEFSLNSDINLDGSLKSNWLKLMNVTSEGHTFDPKFSRNVDEGTLQLLPMLIKAIKKNVILEKVNEEHSSSNPLSDKKYTTTDDYSNKAVFTRNWLRLPTSKLYTIEYKTSPVVYYRTPTENVKYYTKIRKIRNDQRIIDYVDKMINEKAYMGSTKPMIKGQMFTITEASQKKKDISLQRTLKPKTTTQSIKKTTSTVNMKTEDTKNSRCKCSQYMGTLLQKLLSALQNAIPQSTTPISSIRAVKEIISKTLNISQPKTTTERTTTVLTTVPTTVRTTTMPTSIESLIQSYWRLRLPSNRTKYHISEKQKETTTTNVVERTEDDDIFIQKMTEPMKHYFDSRFLEDEEDDIRIKNTSRKNLSNKDLNTKRKIQYEKKIKRQHTFWNNKQNNQVTTEATPNFLKDLNNALYRLIEQNVKVLNSRIISTELPILSTRQSIIYKPKIETNATSHGSNNNNTTTAGTILPTYSTDPSPIPTSLIPTSPTTAPLVTSSTEIYIETNTKKTKKIEIFEKETVVTPSKREVTPKYSPWTLISPLTSPFALPLTSTLVSPLASPFKVNKIETTIAPTPIITRTSPKLENINWEELQIEDVPAWKSMLPTDRPIYLEIHRNDFKRHEEPIDFDYNMNNYAAYDNNIMN